MTINKGLTINVRGYLMDFDIPKVMGILNVTPDSFFSASRLSKESSIRHRIEKMIEDGVDIIDVGGCSTRPGYTLPSEKEEWERIDLGCKIIKEIAPEIALSIDTFRPSIASKAIEIWKADIINDVSGGQDKEMFDLIAETKAIYVLTHNREEGVKENVDITSAVVKDLSWELHELRRLGIKDVILDPGFGFAKNLQQNFDLLNELNEIAAMDCPVLVGLSRKSMIYKTLGCGPEEALTGTIALNAVALEKGADILRVHDVKEAKEIVKLFVKLKGGNIK